MQNCPRHRFAVAPSAIAASHRREDRLCCAGFQGGNSGAGKRWDRWDQWEGWIVPQTNCGVRQQTAPKKLLPRRPVLLRSRRMKTPCHEPVPSFPGAIQGIFLTATPNINAPMHPSCPIFPRPPLFPAFRSGHRLIHRLSRQKQIPGSQSDLHASFKTPDVVSQGHLSQHADVQRFSNWRNFKQAVN